MKIQVLRYQTKYPGTRGALNVMLLLSILGGAYQVGSLVWLLARGGNPTDLDILIAAAGIAGVLWAVIIRNLGQALLDLVDLKHLDQERGRAD